MSGALAARHTDKERDKGRVESTRVKRYWPGRAPAWVEKQQLQQQQDAAPPAEDALVQQVQRTAISAPVVVKRVADPRLARLAQRRGDREEAVEEHRAIRAAEVLQRRQRHRQAATAAADGDDDAAAPPGRDDSDDDEDDDDDVDEQAEEVDEDELQRRRDALKERLKQQQQQEQELLAAAADNEEEEEDDSEYTTDDSDDDDQPGGRPKLVKPVFVRKTERDTIAAREAAELEEAAAEEERKQRLVERQQETRQLLVQVIAADEAAARAAAAPVALKQADELDTADEAEPDAIEVWQRREAARIRRDAAEREAAEAAAAEREKLRHMTEEERLAYLKANPRETEGDKQKAKWKFLQKYWHKGAFFQSNPDDARGTAGTADIFSRDYSAPTGEDNFDKAQLPAVMQVRNFGRSGRTKWTHLLAEDTSTKRREDEWYRRDEKAAGAVTGGYSRDSLAAGAGGPHGGAAKRSGELLSEGFVKPKKFKT